MTFENMDPVHPTPRPNPATVTATMDEQAAHRQAANPRAAGAQPGNEGEPGGRTAAELGTPAVLNHRVVALEAGTGENPLIMHTVDGDRAMMPVTAQVWARAGRLTVIAHDGSELKLTVLGADECADVKLGSHWPVGESESRVKRLASAAAHDVGDVLTFPAWLARTTRISGQRNAAMHALVRELRKQSPGTKVFVGQTFGSEHRRPELEHPYDHRGIVGREGFPTEL
ncbi:hypothetical protein KDK95_13865 [Actinospica sp. MGRD01-02]|uniref:Uncharacterized protein n=1 Tax=Actinospica acidithermotolerans TaxID=2828514 RepID=A0A941IGH2_9ACTN|nr:hypothetical protein [Actinospica acidithermotolerans]MBR7827400.1 hypothetical protein [Actinospica acidithermotolerans]